MDTTRLLAIADRCYFKHLVSFVGSARKHNPERPIHLHLINIGETELNQLVNQKNLTWSTEEKTFGDDEQRKAYCANIRAEVMCRLLETETAPVLYFDADNLIRSSLDPILEQLGPFDVGIYQRHNGMDLKSRVNTGTIFLNQSPRALDFARAWRDRVNEHLYEWFADQIGWANAYDEIAERPTLFNLGERFNDARLHASAEVWAGKWSGGSTQKRFALEEEYYRKVFHGEDQEGDLKRIRFRQCGLSIQYLFSAAFLVRCWNSLNRRLRKACGKMRDQKLNP